MNARGVVVTTARTVVRKLTLDDAPFIVELLNDAAFLQFIGDKRVRTLDDARHYIETVPLASYAANGYGHYLVELAEDWKPIGLCSLVRRDWLGDVDLGFAYLPDYRGKGYAYEAARAVMEYARGTLNLRRLVAITAPRNVASIALLEKLGFSFERAASAPGSTESLNVYVSA